MFTALIVAAGRGRRAARDAALPKQYWPLAGTPMLARTAAIFAEHAKADAVQVVIGAGDHDAYAPVAKALGQRLLPPVAGGATRQDSVRRGLEAISARSPRYVLIHDAARPFLTSDAIDRVSEALETREGAIAALPLADTVKRATAGNLIAETLDRRDLWRAQTPQGFHFPAILDAHRRAAAAGLAFTDDAAVAEWAGITVALVQGSPHNTKITTAEDFAVAERLLDAALETRTGTGFDVHKFVPGNRVVLCGVTIAHTQALEGHSDADVGFHALTDAILGALGDGDIGAHFPPTDPRWRGAPSHLFLADAARRVADRGGRLVNADVTLLCEAPRIGPYREAMRESIARVLETETHRTGVKATTTEGLGFTGRREGIAAMAVATLRVPVTVSLR